MIIDNSEAVTPAVLAAYGNIADPRMREIVVALIRHLQARRPRAPIRAKRMASAAAG
jgi:hypothetical protein